jgi:mannose-1-phosphate guanylyltransferase
MIPTNPTQKNDAPARLPIIRFFSDPNLEWMQRYSAISETRWSMSMLVFNSDGILQALHHHLDPSHVCRLISSVVHHGHDVKGNKDDNKRGRV